MVVVYSAVFGGTFSPPHRELDDNESHPYLSEDCMGQQVRFFLADPEWRDFIGIIRDQGFRIYPTTVSSAGKQAEVATASLLTRTKAAQPYVFLIPEGVTLEDAMKVHNDEEHARIEYSGPVLELSPGKHVEKMVEPGRVYFSTPRGHSQYAIVLKAYQRLARVMQKWPKTTEFRLRVGPETTKAVEAKTITITEYGRIFQIDRS
jgi:hypothetical protein